MEQDKSTLYGEALVTEQQSDITAITNANAAVV